MIDEITDFIWEQCEYLHGNKKEDLKKAVEKHIEFKTLVCIKDSESIVGVCRFNIDEKEAIILDVAVRPEFRKKDVLKQLLLMGIKMYPNVKQLRFNSIDKGREFVTPVSLILNKEK